MLDAFIIEQIKRREEELRQDRRQPRLEPPGRFPLERPPLWDRDRDAGRDDDHNGVVIIDM